MYTPVKAFTEVSELLSPHLVSNHIRKRAAKQEYSYIFLAP